MTEPEENATRSPRFRLSLAACAVRALAEVAMRMPMKPASIENTPPVTKANGVKRERMRPPEPNAMASKSTNTTAKTLNTVVYCRWRYAFAPSRMEAAILRMVSLPSEKERTFFRWIAAKISATAEPRKPIARYCSIAASPY